MAEKQAVIYTSDLCGHQVTRTSQNKLCPKCFAKKRREDVDAAEKREKEEFRKRFPIIAKLEVLFGNRVSVYKDLKEIRISTGLLVQDLEKVNDLYTHLQEIEDAIRPEEVIVRFVDPPSYDYDTDNDVRTCELYVPVSLSASLVIK